jgi:hypothetical protein
MNNRKLICLLGVIILLAGCSVNQMTKATAYPKIYEEKPLNVLILPPINLSTAPEAKEYFSSTLSETASETGYYFLPMEVSNAFLQYEGLYDTEVINDEVLPQFKEYLDADAVLITKILEWDKAYYVIGGNVTVNLDFMLRSTVSGDTLWNFKQRIVYDTSGNNNNLLVSLVETAIKTAAQDYVPIAKVINKKVFSTTPKGKYHPRYNLDSEDIINMSPTMRIK